MRLPDRLPSILLITALAVAAPAWLYGQSTETERRREIDGQDQTKQDQSPPRMTQRGRPRA